MSYDYLAARAKASAALDKFGFNATLTPRPQAVGEGYDPVLIQGTPVTVRVVQFDKRVGPEVGGVATTRRVLYMKADVEPRRGDKIALPDGTVELGEVRPLAPGGVVVFYEVDVVS